jgi:pyruvate dehydrogenase E2 component (dihydrolipoamide acetyltransferase)
MPDFLLPDLGEGLTEAEIVAWHVAVGDPVEVDQTVVEVETAKASVEVPVPFAGVVSALHGRPGEVVQVGAPLVSVAATADAPVPAFSEPGVVTPEPADADSGQVLVGYGTSTARPRGRRPRGRRPHGSRPAPQPAGPSTEQPTPTRTVAVVSPLVRRMARQRGVDLHAITGSGPDGLILRRDVEQAIRRPAGAPDALPRIPLRGTRKAAAELVSRSRREIPEATVWVDVDATALLDARAAMNQRNPAEPVSLLALLSIFAIAGLGRYPELNGRIEGEEIVLSSSIGLGFAAQTDRGLVVPVIRDAQTMSLRRLSGQLAAATQRVRDGSATPADLQGGTFTVNNYGVFGVDGSAAIINHPQVAILGMGRIIDRPWVVAGEIAARKVTQLTLAFDHRVCDGGTAGGFLRYVADCVESPIAAFADLRPS